MEKLPIKDLKLSEYNPRVIDEKNLKNLKNSINTYGWLSPVVINSYPGRENIVISGHQRIKAAEELGQKEVPIIKVNIDPVKEKALNLAMNKIGGEFEEDKLIELLSQIDQENEDLLALTGFDTTEVNYLLGLKDDEKERIFADSAEDAFEAGNKHGIEEGDIIVLEGKHKIFCGDSTDQNNFIKLFGEKKIDLIITSPPYKLDIGYGKYKDNKEYQEYKEMIEKVFQNSKDQLNRGRFICINIGREWGPVNMPARYDQWLSDLGFIFFRNIYWSKPLGSARATTTNRNPFPRYYIPKVQTEIIQIFTNEEDPRNYSSMITYKYGEGERPKIDKIPKILLDKYAGNVWEMMTETTLGADHPAPFPVQLPFNCIRFFSLEGETIFDPFAGSGTSIIAADQLNRKGYGMELDPKYASLIIERYLIYKPMAKFEIIKGNTKDEAK